MVHLNIAKHLILICYLYAKNITGRRSHINIIEYKTKTEKANNLYLIDYLVQVIEHKYSKILSELFLVDKEKFIHKIANIINEETGDVEFLSCVSELREQTKKILSLSSSEIYLIADKNTDPTKNKDDIFVLYNIMFRLMDGIKTAPNAQNYLKLDNHRFCFLDINSSTNDLFSLDTIFCKNQKSVIDHFNINSFARYEFCVLNEIHKLYEGLDIDKFILIFNIDIAAILIEILTQILKINVDINTNLPEKIGAFKKLVNHKFKNWSDDTFKFVMKKRVMLDEVYFRVSDTKCIRPYIYYLLKDKFNYNLIYDLAIYIENKIQELEKFYIDFVKSMLANFFINRRILIYKLPMFNEDT